MANFYLIAQYEIGISLHNLKIRRGNVCSAGIADDATTVEYVPSTHSKCRQGKKHFFFDKYFFSLQLKFEFDWVF